MNSGEKLLNERFKFKKDEPVVEESKEAGAEEYVYMGLWDYNKFPLPQAIYVKKNRYYITQVSTTLDDGRAVNEGDWIMADGEKWHVITPELADDDDVCISKSDEHYVADEDLPPRLIANRIQELNDELAITVAKHIKSFGKMNLIMSYLLKEEYNYISVPSKGVNETIQFRPVSNGWSFRSKFCQALFWDARFSTNTCELVSYVRQSKYNDKGEIVFDRSEMDIHAPENAFDVISIYERAIDFIKRHGKK